MKTKILLFLILILLNSIEVLAATDCSQVTQISQIECEILVTFYNSTNGLNWYNNDGWNETDTPCNWYGVTCFEGYVKSLDLYDNQLTGSILAELGNLSNLQVLDLGFNRLTGSIPVELGNLSNLGGLYLDDNQLCGDIPLSLMNLSNLSYLYLQYNGLNITNLDPNLKIFLGELPYIILEPQNPSACPVLLATLATFEAISNSKKVLLKWQTLFEDKNAGYFIWRGQPDNSQCTSNPENYHDIVFIGFDASKGNGFSGTTYLYQDHTVKPKTIYCYLLEDRDFGGNSIFHWDLIIPVITD